MLKAIVARIVRVSATVRMVGRIFADRVRGVVGAASASVSLVAKAVFCAALFKGALAVFMSPAAWVAPAALVPAVLMTEEACAQAGSCVDSSGDQLNCSIVDLSEATTCAQIFRNDTGTEVTLTAGDATDMTCGRCLSGFTEEDEDNLLGGVPFPRCGCDDGEFPINGECQTQGEYCFDLDTPLLAISTGRPSDYNGHENEITDLAGALCESCPFSGQEVNEDGDNYMCACAEGSALIAIGGASECRTPENFCRTYRDKYPRSDLQDSALAALTVTTGMEGDLDRADEQLCQVCRNAGYESFAGECARPLSCGNTNIYPRGQFLDRMDVDGDNVLNECVCPPGRGILQDASGEEVFVKLLGDTAAQARRICAPSLSNYASYTGDQCGRAGWEVEYSAVAVGASNFGASEYEVVESCGIRVQFIDRSPASTVSYNNLEVMNSCILRHNDGVDPVGAVGPRSAQFCNTPNVFGEYGLPNQSEADALGFSGPLTDQLLVVATVATRENAGSRIYYRGQAIGTSEVPAAPTPIPPPDGGNGGTMTMTMANGGSTMTMTAPAPTVTPPPSDGNGTAASDSGGGGAGPVAGAGILLIGLAYFAFSGGDADAFTFTPRAEYTIEDDIRYYQYGSRLEFRRDDWTMWWTADESRRGESDADFRYGYGGRWSNDSLRASASVYSGDDNLADMRAGLEAEWMLFNWVLRPAYRFRAVSDEGEWRVENGLDFAAKLSQAGWTIRPSVNADLWSSGGASSDAFLRLRVDREF